MRTSLVAITALTIIAAPVAAQTPANVTSALAAPSRAKDAAEDARRKPGEIVAFAQVRPGQTVVDLVPGGGYWTRLFSGAVGPGGKVYAMWPQALAAPGKPYEARMNTLSAEKIANVEPLVVPFEAFALPRPADVIFTSQNLHDFPNDGYGKLDLATWGKQAMAALKPGGRLVVIDHAGAAGTGQTQTSTLHRIEPTTVRSAMEAAGLRFAGMSPVLANPADKHDLRVFDPALRGRTDQFIYAFTRPR